MSIMKILVLLFIFVFHLRNVEAFKIINGLEDIPIFKDMEYVEDSLILFDKIDGRYVSTEIVGNYKKDEVFEFYYKILPNLGWKLKDSQKFERANETLELKSKNINNKISIIFNLYPTK
tara:strand:+ start:1199 stop:1555 length:357 start_codon:yes stop_codon:yes gene_type:complete